MKSKYWLGVFLVLPILYLAGWVAKLETDLKTEKVVMVRMNGFDPVDLISGHYLFLRPDWSQTDCRQFENNSCPTELFGYSYRYYLPEFDAQALDQKIWSDQPRIELSFVCRGKSKPLVKELYIDGMLWDKWLEQIKKANHKSPENSENQS